MVLERAGYVVAEAPSGRDALDAMHVTGPGLVRADLQMPVTGGAELAKRMRSSPTLASIPIVALTGLNDDDAEMMADAVVRKPFEASELLKALSVALT